MQKVLIFSKQQPLINFIIEQFKGLQIEIVDCLDEIYDLAVINKYDVFVTHYSQESIGTLDLLNFLQDSCFQTKTLVIGDQSLHSLERAELYKAGICALIIQPFLPAEIKQKINYLLSIVKVYPNQTIDAGPVSLNPQTGILVVADNGPKPLRRRETDILACLLRHRPRVVTKNMLIDYVWGSTEQTPSFSTLDVYIRRLRIHLGQFHGLIKTSRGFGYYFVASN